MIASASLTAATGSSNVADLNDGIAGNQSIIVDSLSQKLKNRLAENNANDFVKSAPSPSADDEVLMKILLKQISLDHKTVQVAIALDGFETDLTIDESKELKGTGEVKINESVWTKITFGVVLNSDNTASRVDYKIEQ